MLVRSSNNWEQGMAITYEDIKQQRIKLDDKRQQRRAQLQKDIGILMEDYRSSLNFEFPHWFDASDTARPYVSIGVINERNLFEKRSIPSFQLDERNRINFQISTVVDDSPSKGDHFLVSVAMHYSEGSLMVDLNDGDRRVIIANPGGEDGFSEAVEAIKQLIIEGLTDHSLD